MGRFSRKGRFAVYTASAERGGALIVVMVVLVALTMLGLLGLTFTVREINGSGDHKGYQQAVYMAEGAINQVINWFQAPSSFTDSGNFQNGYSGTAASFFAKRMRSNTNYLDDNRASQFTGTLASPDLGYDSTNLDDNTFLNNATTGVLKDFATIGKITQLLVYAPPATGNVATVRATAQSLSGRSSTIEVVLGPSAFAGVRGAIESKSGAQWGGNFEIHWGDIFVLGNMELPSPISNKVPSRDPTAILNNGSYGSGAKDAGHSDRWLDSSISGSYTGVSQDFPGANQPYASPYTNLYQNQTVTVDTLDYETMKAIARATNSYYVAEITGTIRKNGAGASLDFKTLTDGNTQYIFIDTPNQKNPASGGTSFTISVSGNYSTNGIIYAAGNLEIAGTGTGQNLSSVLTPPDPTSGSRLSVSDLRVHVNGLVYTTGSFGGNGNPKVYGAIVAEAGFSSSGSPAVWYNYDVSNGNFPNLRVPVVTRKSWREVR